MYRDRYVRVSAEGIKMSQIIFLIISLIITVFLIISLLTATGIQNRFTSFSLKESVSILSTESFITILGMENSYFTQVLPDDYQSPSLPKLSFELATSVKPGDIRSLLGRELPGFALFDTEIVVAGEGTNYTNLPYESSPPMEVLLKEREVNAENLHSDDGTDSSTPPPQQTTNGRKVVYLYHSHSYESYLPLLKDVKEPNDAYTKNPKANMVAIGSKLAEELEKRGIGVKHDTTEMTSALHSRGLDHGNAYEVSREIVKEAMATNDDLQFYFDLHRDSFRKKTTTATIDGKEYARVVFVVGASNKSYQKNEELAKELNKRLEEKYPGLSRGVTKKYNSGGNNGVYNQDLSENSIIIEFGGVDNTMEELSRTAAAMAEVISEYYWQAEKVNAQ